MAVTTEEWNKIKKAELLAALKSAKAKLLYITDNAKENQAELREITTQLHHCIEGYSKQ